MMAAAVTAARQRAISSRQGEFNNPQGRDAGGCLAAAAVWRQWQYWGAARWWWRLAAAVAQLQPQQRFSAPQWRWQLGCCGGGGGSVRQWRRWQQQQHCGAAVMMAAWLLRRRQQGGDSVQQWSSAVKLIDTETGFCVGHGNVFLCQG
jgi:hypothetical protein